MPGKFERDVLERFSLYKGKVVHDNSFNRSITGQAVSVRGGVIRVTVRGQKYKWAEKDVIEILEWWNTPQGKRAR